MTDGLSRGDGAGSDALALLVSELETALGHALSAERRHTVSDGIARLLQRRHLKPVQALSHLHQDALLFDDLVAEVAVGETYFFRDTQQFEATRAFLRALPPGRKKSAGKLRVWSAGCAGGEETHSLAILLEQEGLAQHSTVLGTDICRAALTRARVGLYGKWSLRSVPDEVLDAYFLRQGTQYALLDRIRRRVDFDWLNLSQDAPWFDPERRFDLIYCRNVLIYLTPETVDRVALRLHDLLSEDGVLVVGPSDPPLWTRSPLVPVVTGGGIVYRRAPPAAGRTAAPARGRASAELPRGRAAIRTRVAAPKPEPAPPAAAETEVMRDTAAIRALADQGQLEQAEQEALQLTERHPLQPGAHHLLGVVRAAAGHVDGATTSLRRALYLDRSLAASHFLLAALLEGAGRGSAAARAYRAARAVCLRRPADEALVLAEGTTASELAAACTARLSRLGEPARGARA